MDERRLDDDDDDASMDVLLLPLSILFLPDAESFTGLSGSRPRTLSECVREWTEFSTASWSLLFTGDFCKAPKKESLQLAEDIFGVVCSELLMKTRVGRVLGKDFRGVLVCREVRAGEIICD